MRPGAWVAELTGLLDLPSWSAGMRVIVYKERPHPGVQLRFTGIDGHRVTCFATDTRTGQLADLELRHRRRARCEDRIRCAKATSLRNLPLHGFDQNQIWCELVAMACELTTWMAILALKGPACAGLRGSPAAPGARPRPGADQAGDHRAGGHRPSRLRLGTQHRHIGQAVPAQRQRHHQVGEDLPPVMHRPRRAPPRQARLQPPAQPAGPQRLGQQ